MFYLSVLFLFIQLGLALLMLYLLIAFITGAPFVPTKRGAIDALLRLAPIRRGMNVIDLGSGDGRILFAAARRGALATGYEINPFLTALTFARARLTGIHTHVRVHTASFWNADFRDADIIYVYLLPWKMDRLESLILASAKPGCLVVSNSFLFRKMPQIARDARHHITVYRVPTNAVSA